MTFFTRGHKYSVTLSRNNVDKLQFCQKCRFLVVITFRQPSQFARRENLLFQWDNSVHWIKTRGCTCTLWPLCGASFRCISCLFRYALLLWFYIKKSMMKLMEFWKLVDNIFCVNARVWWRIRKQKCYCFIWEFVVSWVRRIFSDIENCRKIDLKVTKCTALWRHLTASPI